MLSVSMSSASSVCDRWWWVANESPCSRRHLWIPSCLNVFSKQITRITKTDYMASACSWAVEKVIPGRAHAVLKRALAALQLCLQWLLGTDSGLCHVISQHVVSECLYEASQGLKWLGFSPLVKLLSCALCNFKAVLLSSAAEFQCSAWSAASTTVLQSSILGCVWVI